MGYYGASRVGAKLPEMSEREARALAALAVDVTQQPAQEAGALAYMARLFAQTSLPYRNPGDDLPAWGRSNGGISLAVQPGGYFDETGQWRSVGFPLRQPAPADPGVDEHRSGAHQ